MAHAARDLGSWHAAVKVEHLRSDLLHDIRGRLDRHKLGPEDVAGAHNLRLRHILTVVGRHSSAAPVHLTGEDLITKEPVAKDAAVAVWAVQALSTSDIDQVTEQRVHRVVLLAHIVQVRAVLIDLVAAHHSLQEQERVEVFVFPARCIKEHTNGGVHHLIVTDHEKTRIENSLL